MLDKAKSMIMSRLAPRPQQGESDLHMKDVFADFVMKEFARRQEERRPIEQQWLLNKAFIDGNQFCEINDQTKTLEEAPRTRFWEEREVYNLTASLVESWVAQLTKVKPIPIVPPATMDRKDMCAAKVSTAVLRGACAELDFPKMLDSSFSRLGETGTVVYKTIWDKYGGTLVGYDDDDSPIYEGAADIVMCPAHEIFPESIYSENSEHSMIHARAVNKKIIKERYGLDVSGRSINAYTLSNTSIGFGGAGYNTQGAVMSLKPLEDVELVIEYWEAPSKQYPQGRMGTVIDKRVVHLGPLPYKIGVNETYELPFRKLVAIRVPGMYFGRSPAERILPVQRKYNSISNRIKEHMARATIGVLVTEEGTLVNQAEIAEHGIYPGAVLVTRPGANPPKFLSSEPLSPMFDNQLRYCFEEAARLSGISELGSASINPTGVESGNALTVLKESDDTRLSLTTENIKTACVEVWRNLLMLYKQFSVGTGVVKYVGENGMAEVLSWQASDLTAGDIRIENVDQLSETPAQMRNQITQWLQYGLYNDPETGKIDRHMRARILEMSKMSNWDASTEMETMQKTKANAENVFLRQEGKVPRIDQYDDDVIHLYEHTVFRLSTDFEDMLENNPDLAQVLDDHMMEHEQQKFTKLGAEAKTQAATSQMMSTPLQ